MCEGAGEEPSGVRPVSAATAPRSLLERGAPCRGGSERLAGRGGGRGPCRPGPAGAGCSPCSEVAGVPSGLRTLRPSSPSAARRPYPSSGPRDTGGRHGLSLPCSARIMPGAPKEEKATDRPAPTVVEGLPAL